MHYQTAIVFCLGWLLLAATSRTTCASTVNDVVAAEMKEHHITGVSLAIIENSEISKARGYGFTEQSAATPVTTCTLFRAGSVSKPVAALGALRLVEDGRLSLDEDVNRRLKQWQVPENDFTKDEKVTLRRILSHSAGLTVHGFPGYAVGAHANAGGDTGWGQARQHGGDPGRCRSRQHGAVLRWWLHRDAADDDRRD